MTRQIKSDSKGYVDVNYNHAQMVQWDASDFEHVNKYYQTMNALSTKLYEIADFIHEMTHKQPWLHDLSTINHARIAYNGYQNDLNALIDNFENSIYNYKQQDKKNGFELVPPVRVEPQKIIIKENSLVNPALVIYAKQIANHSTEEFRYIASGTGSLPTKPNQNKLQNENSRLDIFINGGFRNPNGDVVREGVIFPPGLQDARITEFGSFTLPEFGDMQWRNVIDDPAEQIEHDQGATFYSIAHVTVLQINFIEG
jgi:hypothetical protein